MCVFLCGMQKCFTFAQIIKQCAIINMAVSKTKAKLVDVARQLFAKMGVENTTMNDIALASKKGRRTLYTYFKSKEDIYMAVVESELDILSDIMKRVVEKDISPDQKIIEMIYTRLDAVKEVVYRNGTLRATFFRDIWRVEKVRKRFDAKEIQLFKDVLREGVEKGVFQVDDIDMTAELVHYSVKGIEVPYIRGHIGAKLTDETRWGAYFSLIGCAIIVVMNIVFVPVYGYIASAWASVAGYGVIMLLSYWMGQKKYPIQYDLKSLGLYILLAAVLYVIGEQVPISDLVLRLAFRTVLLLLFVAYIVKKDLPLSQLPVINRFIKKK